MASDAAIRVYVLEGQYAQLSYLGFPVSLLIELQRAGLRLDNAKWSTRLSDAGFSVSFFWPAARPRASAHRRRRKRKPRLHPNLKIAHGQVGTACTRVPLPSKAAATASFKGSSSTPIDAHPSPPSNPPATEGQLSDSIFPSPGGQLSNTILPSPSPEEPLVSTAENIESCSDPCSVINSDTTESVDNSDSLQHLKDADTIAFEIQNEEPGVKHTTNGRTGWTPIRIKRNREPGDYDVEFLRRCKKIEICGGESGWRASIRSGSTLLSTPIAARTRSHTTRPTCPDIT